MVEYAHKIRKKFDLHIFISMIIKIIEKSSGVGFAKQQRQNKMEGRIFLKIRESKKIDHWEEVSLMKNSKPTTHREMLCGISRSNGFKLWPPWLWILLWYLPSWVSLKNLYSQPPEEPRETLLHEVQQGISSSFQNIKFFHLYFVYLDWPMALNL